MARKEYVVSDCYSWLRVNLALVGAATVLALLVHQASGDPKDDRRCSPMTTVSPLLDKTSHFNVISYL